MGNKAYSKLHQLGVMSALILAIGLFTGCMGTRGANTFRLANAPDVPGAEGTVRVKLTDQNNTDFIINVERLAPADQVVKGTNTYVIWIRPLDRETPPQNVGALQVDKNYNANFEGVTPHKQFQVFITPEKSTTPNNPTNREVLSANVYRGQ